MMHTKKKITKRRTTIEIRRGRPHKESAHRQTLPGVRVLEAQYRKVHRIAKQQRASISEVIRAIIDAA